MIVKRGKQTYCYKTERINGKPVTKYVGKLTSPQAQAYEARKEEKTQQQHREQEISHLQSVVDQAMQALQIMVRAHLLLVGYYERKSEIRKLQEDAQCTTLSSCNSNC
jgi:hypothetical protein